MGKVTPKAAWTYENGCRASQEEGSHLYEEGGSRDSGRSVKFQSSSFRRFHLRRCLGILARLKMRKNETRSNIGCRVYHVYTAIVGYTLSYIE